VSFPDILDLHYILLVEEPSPFFAVPPDHRKWLTFVFGESLSADADNAACFKFCRRCGMALDLKTVMKKKERIKASLSFTDESIDEKDLDKKLEERVNKKVEAAIKERFKRRNN
jgi:hypothetical protein